MRGISQACALGELRAAVPYCAARGIVPACLPQLSFVRERVVGWTGESLRVPPRHRLGTGISAGEKLSRKASRRKLLAHHRLAVGPGILRCSLPNLRTLRAS